MAAIKSQFPTAENQGCWFHFCQSIYRQISKLEIIKAYKSKKSFYQYSKYLMCLALLPENLIEEAFRKIKSSSEQNLEKIDQQNFNALCDVFDMFWLKSVGAEKISVHKNEFRTNNSQESINGRLKMKIGIHQNFLKFYESIKALTISFENDIERLASGKRISRPKKKENIAKSTAIKDAAFYLQQKQISLMEFLEKCSKNIGKYVSNDSYEIPPQNDFDGVSVSVFN